MLELVLELGLEYVLIFLIELVLELVLEHTIKLLLELFLEQAANEEDNTNREEKDHTDMVCRGD